MIYVLLEWTFDVKEYFSFPSWRSFLSEKIDLFSEIILVRKEHIGNNLCLTADGYNQCSITFSELEAELAIDQIFYRFCANVLLTKGVLHFHSAFVLYKGKALIFTGPSGIGKTTQAELWRDYQDALIVNGDASLLRPMDDGRWWAFGTPVHGSSPYCENEKAPIAAIIALEQGKDNVLTPMDNFSALSACVPEFYRPKLDEAAEETFWNSVDALFEAVPVYHLTCRPDRDATELVKKELLKIE